MEIILHTQQCELGAIPRATQKELSFSAACKYITCWIINQHQGHVSSLVHKSETEDTTRSKNNSLHPVDFATVSSLQFNILNKL